MQIQLGADSTLGFIPSRIFRTLLWAICLNLTSVAQIRAQDQFNNALWFVDDSTDAVLEIASNSDEAKELSPVLHLLSGEQVTLRPMTIHPGETLSIDIKEALSPFLDSPKTQRGSLEESGQGLWGSASIEITDVRGLTGWTVMSNAEESWGFNSMFASGGSRSIRALWWRPTEETSNLFAVLNTSSQAIEVRVSPLELGGTRCRSLKMRPKQMRLLRLDELCRGVIRDHGGLIFETEAGPFLQISTTMLDRKNGIAMSFHSHDPSKRMSRSLQVPGALIGADNHRLAGVDFAPQLFVANYSDSESIGLKLTLHSASGFDQQELDGQVYSFQRPPEQKRLPRKIVLAPLEVRKLDLRNAWGRIQPNSGLYSVELTYDSGDPSDIVAELVTANDDLSYTFYDPFLDSAWPISGQTVVSMNLAGESTNLIAIKNLEEEQVLASLMIYYEDSSGSQVYDFHTVLAGLGLATFDLAELRDQGIPDSEGRVLPRDLTSGHIRVSSASGRVIAGDFAFDSEGSKPSCFGLCECPNFPFDCIIPPEPGPGNACEDVPPPPPPLTILDQFERTYKYKLQNDPPFTMCNYKNCSGQNFLSVCPSTFSTAVDPPPPGSTVGGCFVQKTQKYRITIWSNNSISCTKIGEPQGTLIPCF